MPPPPQEAPFTTKTEGAVVSAAIQPLARLPSGMPPRNATKGMLILQLLPQRVPKYASA